MMNMQMSFVSPRSDLLSRLVDLPRLGIDEWLHGWLLHYVLLLLVQCHRQRV